MIFSFYETTFFIASSLKIIVRSNRLLNVSRKGRYVISRNLFSRGEKRRDTRCTRCVSRFTLKGLLPRWRGKFVRKIRPHRRLPLLSITICFCRGRVRKRTSNISRMPIWLLEFNTSRIYIYHVTSIISFVMEHASLKVSNIPRDYLMFSLQ